MLGGSGSCDRQAPTEDLGRKFAAPSDSGAAYWLQLGHQMRASARYAAYEALKYRTATSNMLKVRLLGLRFAPKASSARLRPLA